MEGAASSRVTIGPLKIWRGRFLAGGCFGKVYTCTVQNGGRFPIKGVEKVIFQSHKACEKNPQSLFHEETMMQRMSDLGQHPNIVVLWASWAESNSLGRTSHLIIPHYPQQLLSYVASMKLVWDHLAILRKLLEVSAGLVYLKGHHIIHNDIKAENVCLDREGRAVLIDFGCARMLGGGENTRLGNFCYGTPLHASPEKLSSPYVCGYASDVYAFGMLVFECFVGTPDIPGCVTLDDLRASRKDCVCPSWGAFNQKDVVSLVDRMWCVDPALRPTIEEVAQALEDIISVREKEMLEERELLVE